MKEIGRSSFVVAAVCLAALLPSQVWAEGRTTPVEVKNPVSIDATSNTVKAEQSGSWTTTVAGTPAVAQSGAWNVGISGTPNMNVANTPTVNISSTNNTVAAPTVWQKVQPWTTDQVLADGQFTTSPFIQTAGYKEFRACIGSSSSSANLRVHVLAKNGAGAYTTTVAIGNFATPANFISDNSNFSCPAGRSIFSFPVLSDVMYLQVSNSTGGSVTVYNWSWVYLVN
ncbi:MAG: hypothetical protein A2Z18_05295 [Armatimonadetes bacterium RBG_16_58_9]|nr:MAG: hypothetical protein A2Z18_05295 [Armatimonadetes bacterium RBG_16_58_9]